MILRDDLDAMLITGPGHRAPANLANLYLESSLREGKRELPHCLRFPVANGFESRIWRRVRHRDPANFAWRNVIVRSRRQLKLLGNSPQIKPASFQARFEVKPILSPT